MDEILSAFCSLCPHGGSLCSHQMPFPLLTCPPPPALQDTDSKVGRMDEVLSALKASHDTVKTRVKELAEALVTLSNKAQVWAFYVLLIWGKPWHFK